jgi:hypothetical protein
MLSWHQRGNVLVSPRPTCHSIDFKWTIIPCLPSEYFRIWLERVRTPPLRSILVRERRGPEQDIWAPVCCCTSYLFWNSPFAPGTEGILAGRSKLRGVGSGLESCWFDWWDDGYGRYCRLDLVVYHRMGWMTCRSDAASDTISCIWRDFFTWPGILYDSIGLT